MLPPAWTLIELNPAHVSEQRPVLGKRGTETDQIDLAAKPPGMSSPQGAPSCGLRESTGGAVVGAGEHRRFRRRSGRRPGRCQTADSPSVGRGGPTDGHMPA
jgi:transposase